MKKKIIKVRFEMVDAEPYILPFDQALRVLESPQQQVMLYDKDGGWTGQMINKAFVKCTDVDLEEAVPTDALALPSGEREPTEEERQRAQKIRKAISKMMRDKRV